MTIADWIIVIGMAASVIGGARQGFFRAVCSLGGLIAGLVLAAWNYGRVAALLLPLMHNEMAADAVGFLAIALVVMALAAVTGTIVARTLHRIGLGCLDTIAGAAFGLLTGVFLVTLCLVVTLAFFPDAHWLAAARLPHWFFGFCQLSTHMSPAELAGRVHRGLKFVEEEAPLWLHPHPGIS